ncbi:GIY-YIG nuclease family protein [Rhodohalobacter mucosus]|uniref:Endonuclease n=1 Tax=Rhodohalobacter mucosus TaxID=2079485 RepID=A0A316TRW5_9BACT|nr:endonuclease [Rhodohalobacter mucosus]
MIHVYAIKSLNRNYIYVGMTDELERRLDQHQNGYEKTTRPYRPFKLIYTELHQGRKSARAQEKYLKSAAGFNYDCRIQ